MTKMPSLNLEASLMLLEDEVGCWLADEVIVVLDFRSYDDNGAGASVQRFRSTLALRLLRSTIMGSPICSALRRLFRPRRGGEASERV